MLRLVGALIAGPAIAADTVLLLTRHKQGGIRGNPCLATKLRLEEF
jgi:hypothetical protein